METYDVALHDQETGGMDYEAGKTLDGVRAILGRLEVPPGDAASVVSDLGGLAITGEMQRVLFGQRVILTFTRRA